MTDETPLNPVQIEQQIQAIADEISKGVRIVSDREYEAAARRRQYDREFAIAYVAAEGSIQDRKYAAELATAESRRVAEEAEIAFRHAQRTARALEKKLDALRSVGVSVRTMYGAQS